MKIGDFIRWRDHANYPGLCGIVTQERSQTVGAHKRGNRGKFLFIGLPFLGITASVKVGKR